MPKFEDHKNIAAEQQTFGQHVEATKQETAALKSKRDTIAARMASAPEGARGAMQSAIDGLNAKITKNEALLIHVEKPTSNVDTSVENTSVDYQRARVAAALRRPSIIVNPDILAAGLKAQAAEDSARVQAEYDAKPVREKLFMGSLDDLAALDKKKAA